MFRVPALLIALFAVLTITTLAFAPIFAQGPPDSTGESVPTDNTLTDNKSPGGIDDELTTPSSDGPQTDGLWSAQVGDVEFTGLNAENVGDTLFEGNFVTRTYVDPEGILHTVRECSNIPEIKIEKNTSSDVLTNASIRLVVDYKDCVVKIGLIKYQIDENQFNNAPVDLPMIWRLYDISNGPTVYFRPINDPPLFAPPMFSSPARTRRASLSTEVKGLGGSGEVLTRTRVKMLYVVHPTAGVTQVYDYQGSCYVYSPLGFLGSNWFLNDCRSDPAVNNGDHLLGYAKGNYGIEIPASYTVNGPLAHRSSAKLKGKYSGLHGTCTWSPNPDGTTVSWGLLSLTLGIDCFETFY